MQSSQYDSDAYNRAYSNDGGAQQAPIGGPQQQDAQAGSSNVASQYPPPAYAPIAAPAAPRQGKGWVVAIVVIVCIFLLTAFCVASCSSMVDRAVSTLSPISSSSYDLNAYGEPSIAVIDIDGTIQYDGSACSPEGLKRLLDRAENDPDIKGVVLRVNSGGGTATAGEEMSDYVHEFSKPVVVSSAATNASAAYEISSQADYIFTARTTSIGSIGVALQVTDLSGLYEKLGISIDTITSKESKDASYGNRPLTEEERQWYQNIVDQIDADFMAVVARGRDMTLEEVAALANGLPYTGLDAVENGLADEIGTLEDAVLYASNLAGFDEALDTIDYGFTSSDLMSLLDVLGQSDDDVSDMATRTALEKLRDRYGF